MSSTIPFDCKKFVCAICQNYLSTAPVYLLQDNRDLCSNCVFGDLGKAFRNVSLERLLVNAYFPCKNASQGCTLTYKFGEEDDHTSKCTFKPIECPIRKRSECEWNGRFGAVREHISEKHAKLISENAAFIINVNEDTMDTFVVLNSKNRCIVDYVYNSKSGDLKYTVALLDVGEQDFQVELRKYSKPDSLTPSCKPLKEHKAVCYSDDLSQRIPEQIINLHVMKGVLQNATSILISLATKAKQELSDSTNLVKSDIVNFFKCRLCRENLKLPIFEDANSSPICSYCYDNSKEQFKYKMVPEDNELSCLLAKENYCCKHNYCTKIVRGTCIVNHERSCPFRMYKCFICQKNLLYSIAQEHYETMHPDANCFEQEYEFVMQARTSVSCCTLFQHELIVIFFTFDPHFKIEVKQSGVIPNYKVIIELQCTNKDLNAPSLKYVFNETAGQSVNINSWDLLACFTTEIGVRIYFDSCK
uniref:RING-type E3 ubiquitin transferase n=1 Tax=Photinus pyralis TaxID=7054 RepID=A0A1Y1M5S3_PHOPY